MIKHWGNCLLFLCLDMALGIWSKNEIHPLKIDDETGFGECEIGLYRAAVQLKSIFFVNKLDLKHQQT